MSLSMNEKMRRVDLVVPIYNEEKVIKEFYSSLRGVIDQLPYKFTIYFVNDGSIDSSEGILNQIARADSRVKVIELSRNFGHQAALTAGLDYCSGEAVITMDGDGQHPPELIPRMVEMYLAGNDIVLTQRTSDKKLPFFKRKATAIFYRLLNRIGDIKIIPGSADYRLLSREGVRVLKQMGEYHRFLRGMISWTGYRSVIIPYVSPERLAGKPQYSVKKMAKLALDAIFSFSLVPLQIGVFIGIFFFVLAAGEVVYVLSFWLRGKQDMLVPGWSSMMFIVLMVGGIMMIIMGIIGAYVGYIFQQVKQRPIYLVKKDSHTALRPSDDDGRRGD